MRQKKAEVFKRCAREGSSMHCNASKIRKLRNGEFSFPVSLLSLLAPLGSHANMFLRTVSVALLFPLLPSVGTERNLKALSGEELLKVL